MTYLKSKTCIRLTISLFGHDYFMVVAVDVFPRPISIFESRHTYLIFDGIKGLEREKYVTDLHDS